MKYSEEFRPRYEDSISLVDLAATFIRRRRVFYAVFLVVTLLGVGYAMLATDKYEYVSMIQAAATGGGKSVEASATTIATLENRWLPELKSTYLAQKDHPLPFGISFGNPKNTTLLRLSSETSKENAELVQEVHASLIEKVRVSQNLRIEKEKSSLKRQIESLEKVLQSLQRQEGAGEAIAAALQDRVDLERELEQLEPVEILVVARESAEKRGPKLSVIVILAALCGGFMGVFMAFLAEFCRAVKGQMEEEFINE